MTPPEPTGPDPLPDAALFAKVPVPPEIMEWARASCDEEDIIALLAEARAGGAGPIGPLLDELEAAGSPRE